MLTRNLRFVPVALAMAPHVIGFTLWGALVVLFHTLSHHPERLGAEPGMLMALAQAMSWTDVGIPFSAIAALGGALAIFLGFRNNSAYDRWWEARKIWGALVNDSRSWCRQVLAWSEPAPDADDPAASVTALHRELVHRHLAFVHGLSHHLRGQRTELLAAVADLVGAEEAPRYEQVPNVPTALLIEQGKRLTAAHTRGQLEHFRHLTMDGLLTRLSDIQGKCERIKHTPLPRQYDAFPRWFAYCYGVMVPFGLVEPIGWGAIPISVVITILFLALELSGRLVEAPFEGRMMDTPMTALATTIERDLRAALGEPLPPPIEANENGTLM